MPSPSSEIATGVREGDLLAGKYRIDRVLGTGGMGVVVSADRELCIVSYVIYRADFKGVLRRRNNL